MPRRLLARSGGRLRAAVLGALSLLLPACETEPAFEPQPLPSTFFGLDLEYGRGEPDGVPWPNDVAFTPHRVVRLWLAGGGLWADVQRAGRGSEPDYGGIDSYMSQARLHEQRVVYVVAMTPTFAVAPEHRSALCAWPTLYPGGCNPPDDWDDVDEGACLAPASDYRGPSCAFKEFLVGLVRRYRGSGVQEGCPASDPRCHGVIHFYELWNEVDSFDWDDTRFWAGAASGEETDSRDNAFRILARMVVDAAEVIRREDPSALIIGPSFTGSDGGPAMQAFYAQDDDAIAAAVDVLSFHGYVEVAEAHPPELVRDLIEQYQAARDGAARVHPELAEKPMWDTEGGWGVSYAPDCEPVGDCLLDPDAQAAYLARWFLHHWDMGIDNATWFHWGDNGWGEIWCPHGASSDDHFIGCERLGSDDPQPSIAGRAYLELSRWLTGSVRPAPCEVEDGSWTCPIEHPDLRGGEGRILWVEEAEPRDVAVPDGYGELRRLDGTRETLLDATIEVGALPVLVD